MILVQATYNIEISIISYSKKQYCIHMQLPLQSWILCMCMSPSLTSHLQVEGWLALGLVPGRDATISGCAMHSVCGVPLYDAKYCNIATYCNILKIRLLHILLHPQFQVDKSASAVTVTSCVILIQSFVVKMRIIAFCT